MGHGFDQTQSVPFPSPGIRARLSFAIAVSALVPVLVAMFFARAVVQQASERYFVPEIRERLEQALVVYGELAQQTKTSLRSEALVLALDPRLVHASQKRDRAQLSQRLKELADEHREVVSLTVMTSSGETLADLVRETPINEKVEKPLNVAQAIGEDESLQLSVLFAVPSARFEEFTSMGEFIELYAKLAERRLTDQQSYLLAFGAILGGTIVIALALSARISRRVVRRVRALANAAQRVAKGDLEVRVTEIDGDELGDLGAAFNRMLREFNRMIAEIEASRGRIEYLSRLASWQEMARRLAHEIKNPLTPIQLAVQEVHQRLVNVREEDRKLLDAVLEIVEAEVGTLRRLVGEFSQFARLPESRMVQADLAAFLQELKQEAAVRADFFLELPPEEALPKLTLSFELPSLPMNQHLDAQMLRRVIINLIQNAAQACRDKGSRVLVSANPMPSGGHEVLVEDDGPGVPPAMWAQVFEPYVTTKHDGTGLGLAIVKKIVIDHRGDVEMRESRWGGACVRIVLPA